MFMSIQEKNRPDFANRNLSIREQNKRQKDIDKLTRRNRFGKVIGGILLSATVISGLAYAAFEISEPGSDAMKLPNITTAVGLNEAHKGVNSGNLVEIEALAPYQDLNLKGTDLLREPRDFAEIAKDSTANLSDDSRSLEEGLIFYESDNGNGVAQPNTPYFVPTTPRALELHNLEEKVKIL
jgi:hypothetical protein